jgi:hypothetical protein
MAKRIIAVGLFLARAVVNGQEFRGSITGSVTDAQGAAVPNVRISATESATGTESKTVADASGHYAIPFLAPGTYRVRAEAAGFQGFTRENVRLDVGERPVLDIRLEVGDLQQTVTISAEAPLVESGSASIGQTVTTQQVEDIPLNGRTPMMLAQFAMGVVGVPTGTAVAGGATPWDTAGPSMLSIGGAPSGSAELLLDGSPDNSWNMQVAYNPPQDAVRELRVQAFEADAAFGHTGGGVVNHVTKSGTNEFHGSAYEFNKTAYLAANNFFTNKAGLPKPFMVYNQYGLTAGGPVWVPRAFDGRNKVFWFFAFEEVRNPAPQQTITTVPTAAERTGDLSALLKISPNYQIYDPLTGAQSGTQISRMPFVNNIIPGARINPITQNYLKFYPAPNYGNLRDGTNNFAANVTGKLDFSNELGRLDFNISERHKIFWNIRHSALDPSSAQDYFSNPSTGLTLFRTNWGVTFDDVYSFTPSTVANVRLNWTRFQQRYTNNSVGLDPTTLGFPAYMATNSRLLQMPAINFSGNVFNPLNVRSTLVTNNPGDSFQLFASVSHFFGSQNLKAGVDMREYRMSNFTPGNSTGSFSFGTNWTNGPFSNSGAAPLGQEFASFLLGYPTSGSYDLATASTAKSRYYALFLQDDYRVRSNLTINVGLRFELETPTTERYNRAVGGFDANATSPIAAAALANYAKSPISQIPVSQFKVPGGLVFPTASNRNLYETPSKIFSPRFGFAWTPRAFHGSTVIRGGAAVFAYPIGITGNQLLNQQGFSQTTQFQATTNNYLSPAGELSNPFPSGIQQPPGSSLGLGTYLGQAITFFNPSRRNAYSFRWNFGIQRALPGNIGLEVAYIGNHSVHLPIATEQLDAIPQQYLSKSLVRDQATINLLGGSVANPFAGLLPGSTSLNGSTVALQQLLVPFPQFPVNGVTMQQDNAGSSYFNSLNTRVEKRFSKGLSVIGNFVWSNLIDRTSYLNPFDPSPEKRISADSRPLRFITAVTYQLPVGKGMLVPLHSRVTNALLGGWVVTGTYTVQPGPPLSWGNLIYYGGDLHLAPRQVDAPAFDVTRFNTVSNQQLASNVRYFPSMFSALRADGINALNASVAKKFYFDERKYLSIRMEAFNAPNRPAFAAPNLSATTTAFGLITSQTINPRQVQLGARLVW